MGFGYLLLAVKSEQDNYLIGNPQFTFFKAVYKKHTNFAIDYQFLDFTGETENAFGKKLYIDIPKNGDLLHRMYLTFDLNFPTLNDQKRAAPLIYNLIDYIDLYIGGQLIDRHYSSWLAIWDQLIEKENLGLANMTGIRNQMTTTGGNVTYTIPLRFWFNNNIGLALPLIALQYNDIKLEVRIKDKSYFNAYARGIDNTGGAAAFPTTANESNVKINRIRLINELIHLDKDERRLFSTNNHEYLITQVQTNLNGNIQNYTDLYDKTNNFNELKHKLELRFTYPIKELFWSIQDIKGNYESGNSQSAENKGIYEYNYWNNYTLGAHQMVDCNLVINGKDLMEPLPARFYSDIQQYQYHNSNGLQNINNDQGNIDITGTYTAATGITTDPDYFNKGIGIYSYSFGLRPEDYQPSGSLNFSKLESAVLKFRLNKNPVEGSGTTGNGQKTNKTINVYALNYNVLRIMSGQAGLAFIN